MLYEFVAEQRLTGYAILLLKLYPVQYVPSTGALSYYETITVRVTLASAPGAPSGRKIHRFPTRCPHPVLLAIQGV